MWEKLYDKIKKIYDELSEENLIKNKEEIDYLFCLYTLDPLLGEGDYYKLLDYFHFNDDLKKYIYRKVDVLVESTDSYLYYFRLLSSLDEEVSYDNFILKVFPNGIPEATPRVPSESF